MKILLVDDDRDFRWATGNMLESAGYRVIYAGDGEEALSLLEKDIPHLILLDYRMQRMNGLEVAAAMRRRIPGIPVIMITAYPAIDSAVKAMRMGVYDYVTKPFDNNDLLFAIKRALEKKDLMDEVANLRYILSERASLYESMGKSDPIKKLVRQVEKVAPTSFTVLIEGESGTGKELVARSIHNLSRVKNGPFVAVDCGAIPETLIESELFGCMKGAFTGAHTDKPGQFELADRGTLFLDEVGNLPYTMQQKFLRAMQERVVQRLGGKKPVEIDVRIVAAANRSLEKDVGSGRIRRDLFFRLTEFTLRIPPLRERKEDIPYLAKKFMDQLEGELNKKGAGFSREALVALSSYHWPGNVRELRNVIGQAVLLCEDHAPIEPYHMTFSSRLMPVSKGRNPDAMEMIHDGKKSLNELVTSYVDLVEKKIIEEAMAEFDGNKSRVARRLKVDYKTLLRKIKALGIG
ncbi:MAG: sigma-54 dependent transcriptional regulator [Thermodesulfobacteriota bacterium]|nr:sigma-54 dependent transcriptional regulator [Thermodesulfobacteriota bacterium]